MEQDVDKSSNRISQKNIYEQRRKKNLCPNNDQ